MSTQSTERYSRQKDIIPAEKLASCKVTVVGVGAVGRQVALQLAAIGISYLQLIDFDTVEESNLASQGYLENDLTRPKIQATADLCQQISQRLETQEVNGRFRKGMEVGNILFNCVDSIDIRRLIWNAVKDRVSFYCDSRMAAEVLRVITALDEASRTYYPKTLFRGEEAYQASCTAKTTIYCANIAAGLMLTQFTKYLRGLPIDRDIQFNLLTTELTVSEES